MKQPLTGLLLTLSVLVQAAPPNIIVIYTMIKGPATRVV